MKSRSLFSVAAALVVPAGRPTEILSDHFSGAGLLQPLTGASFRTSFFILVTFGNRRWMDNEFVEGEGERWTQPREDPLVGGYLKTFEKKTPHTTITGTKNETLTK